jgi:hypothetical protein
MGKHRRKTQMIKVKNGRTKAKGTISEVVTDLAHASSNVVEFLQETGLPREEAVRIVKEAVEIGCMTDDERRAKAEQQADAFVDALRYALMPEGKGLENTEEGEQ